MLIRSGKFHFAINEGENGEILTQPNVFPGVGFSASLPHQDITRLNLLAIKFLDAESFGLAVSA